MKLGILSDTHNNTESTEQAVDMLRSQSPDLIIHCGDIVSPYMLDYFQGLPMRFIFGNNETERDELNQKSAEYGFGIIEDTLELELSGKQFFVYHGTDSWILRSRIELGRYDYVLHGHSHKVRDEQIGDTRVINPGALFRATEYTIAFLDIEQNTLEITALS